MIIRAYRGNPFTQRGETAQHILNELEFSPWKGYRIEQYVDAKGATRHRLEGDSQTPYWWTSYNKVKHNRTLDDPDTQEKFFNRANLGNLCDAFSALYILEKRYMMSVGGAEDYNRVQKSQLFERTKPSFCYEENSEMVGRQRIRFFGQAVADREASLFVRISTL